MVTIKSIPGLKHHYNALPQGIRNYFPCVLGLIDAFPLEVGLSYVFSRTELAQNDAIYCGLLKLHRAHREVVESVLLKQRSTRAEYRKFFATVFNSSIPDSTVATIQKAEGIRDRVMHGKTPPPSEIRNAVAQVLEYTRDLDALVQQLAGFHPCGDLRGFKGAAAPLDKSTTGWVLKGMGFSREYVVP